jgi:hypothetical protein
VADTETTPQEGTTAAEMLGGYYQQLTAGGLHGDIAGQIVRDAAVRLHTGELALSATEMY